MNYKLHPYGYTLSNDPKKAIPEVGVKIRKKINPFTLKVVDKLNTRPIKIVEDKRDKDNNEPTIYISSHAFREDAMNALLAMGKDGYILTGNMDVLFKTFNGFAVWVYGTIAVDRKNEESKKSSLAKMERVLDLDSNVLIFPEGTWNLSTNELLTGFHGGFYDLALKTGRPIVPIVTIESYGNCYAAVGKQIYVDDINEDVLREVIDFNFKCIDKVLDLPIKEYQSYKDLTSILTKLKSNIEFLCTLDNGTKETLEVIISKSQVLANDALAIINSFASNCELCEEEISIVNRIKKYLSAMKHSRKRIVVEYIRNEMASTKYELLERYGERRFQKDGESLEDEVAQEKEYVISTADYYDREEESQSVYKDPLVDEEENVFKLELKK